MKSFKVYGLSKVQHNHLFIMVYQSIKNYHEKQTRDGIFVAVIFFLVLFWCGTCDYIYATEIICLLNEGRRNRGWRKSKRKSERAEKQHPASIYLQWPKQMWQNQSELMHASNGMQESQVDFHF